ncbi:MAG: hypothetical protein ABW185_27750 [Sedimenticola sp.]
MSKNKKIKKLEAQIEALSEELWATKAHDDDDHEPEKLNLKKSADLMPSPNIKPTPFKGSATDDWVIWLRNYNQIAMLNKWSEEYKLARLATVLESDANSKYWECSDDERSDWDSMVTALTNKFAPESNRATFQATLETRRRRRDETLDAYMSTIKNLARKAFPEWDEKYRDLMVQKYFTDGLDNSFRIWVLQANPKTADEALQVALRTEANLQKQAPAHANTAYVAETRDTDGLAEAIVLALERRGIGSTNSEGNMQGARGRGYSGYRGRGRGRGRPGVCHSCGQNGHYWRDAMCPNAPSNQGNGQGTGGGW